MPIGQHKTWDCLIIGGGPAGLTAALYLARFRRSALVIDAAQSRAATIPRTHNHPGFPDGITGTALLGILRRQAEHYGACVQSGTVHSIAQGVAFVCDADIGRFEAKRVILATGITDLKPTIEGGDGLHETVRYCPVCDGFEAQNKRIAVYGDVEQAKPKARFLSRYSERVVLIPRERGSGRDDEIRSSYAMAPAAASKFAANGSAIMIGLRDGSRIEADLLYPALGSRVHSDLAVALGARTSSNGCLLVDGHQATTVPSLYAAGDVVSDLHQLVVAEAHAAIAACAVNTGLP